MAVVLTMAIYFSLLDGKLQKHKTYKVSGCEHSLEFALRPSRGLVGSAEDGNCIDRANELAEAIWMQETAPTCEGLACTEFAAVSEARLDSSETIAAS